MCIHQWLVCLCLYWIVSVCRQVRLVPETNLPQIHMLPTHPALQTGIVQPGLHLQDIIHRAHSPVHLSALGPGLGVHQGLVPQAHQDHHGQDPMPHLVPAPGCSWMLVVLMCQLALILHPSNLYQCMVMMMIPL